MAKLVWIEFGGKAKRWRLHPVIAAVIAQNRARQSYLAGVVELEEGVRINANSWAGCEAGRCKDPVPLQVGIETVKPRRTNLLDFALQLLKLPHAT
jgi:hypothetical protein